MVMARCGPANVQGSGFIFAGGVSGKSSKLLDLKFSRLMFRTKDLRPVQNRIIQKYRNEVDLQFASQGSRGGFPWRPLKPSTIEGRVRAGFAPGPILQRTGTLRDSLVNSNHRLGCKGNTPLGWFLGTQVKYAVYHQSRAPRKKLPRRAFLTITRSFRLFVIRAIHRFVVKGE
jgi:phage gpG-like protein